MTRSETFAQVVAICCMLVIVAVVLSACAPGTTEIELPQIRPDWP